MTVSYIAAAIWAILTIASVALGFLSALHLWQRGRDEIAERDAENERLKRQVCELQQHIQKTRMLKPNKNYIFDCDRVASGER